LVTSGVEHAGGSQAAFAGSSAEFNAAGEST
jgi:hypothetical protein